MFLVKCKCGCFFTLKKDDLKNPCPVCPNCRTKIPIDAYVSVAEDQGLSKVTSSISYIPDDAKITITFDT